MKKSKFLLLILLGILTTGVLTACGSSSTGNQTQNETQTKEKKSSGGNGKALVVYYSASGNTKEVANAIAKEREADTFELVPVDPYTDADLDWTNDDSRVSKEHDNPDTRDVKLTSTKIDNWDSYDTIFIGYPIWWGIAAWPVNSFVESNDFTDKTVIPFCTAASSGIGESGELLAKMAGTGNWLEGTKFQQNESTDSIAEWLEGLK